MRKAQASLILLLAVFYVGIAYLAMHPNVSAAYRSYYITRDSDLTVRERRALQAIQPPVEISYADKRVGYDGWHAEEQGYRWSAGRSSKILFLLQPGVDRQGMRTLSLKATPLDRQQTEVSINGKLVHSGVISADSQVDIAFPASLLLEGENVIRIDCPDAHGTETDRRRRGIALASFSLR